MSELVTAITWMHLGVHARHRLITWRHFDLASGELASRVEDERADVAADV